MIATSQVEKHFQKHNIYKRSKRYYDIKKMVEEEHSEELSRRKPSQPL